MWHAVAGFCIGVAAHQTWLALYHRYFCDCADLNRWVGRQGG